LKGGTVALSLASEENFHPDRVDIYGVRISVYDRGGSYGLCFRHTGDFRLNDYEELDLEVKSARLVKRK